MNWNKLHSKHYFSNPVEYVHAFDIFPVKEYDILYENQKDLDHPVWREFDEKYKVGFEFKEDIKDIDLNREIIALWFFRERSDNNHPPGLMLKEKFIAYMPNHFLITKYKDITIKEAKRKVYEFLFTSIISPKVLNCPINASSCSLAFALSN